MYISFGLIAGMLNVVPYLGSTVGALLPALVALTISPIKALLVLVLFVVLNQAEGYILQPVIMRCEVNLHPAMVLVSFLVAGALLGLVGVLIAIPAAVVCVTLMDELSPEALPAGRGAEHAVRERGRGPFLHPRDDFSLAVHKDHLSARGIGYGLCGFVALVGIRLLDGRRRGRRLGQRVILRVLAQACLRRLQPVQQDRAYREQHDEHGHRRHPYTKPEPHDRPL